MDCTRSIIRTRGGNEIELENAFNDAGSADRVGNDSKFDLGQEFGRGEGFICGVVGCKLTF